MPPPPSSPRFLPPLFFILFFPIQISSQNDNLPFLTYCSGSNFTSPGLYESNLRRLLAALIASTPISYSFFSTDTAGNSSSPLVFGLAQCRADATDCASCLRKSAVTATADSPGGCGKRMSAALRFDLCLLRYSDRRFFGTVEDRKFIIDGKAAPNASVQFSSLAQNLMNMAVTQVALARAASSKTSYTFSNSSNSESKPNIYAMAWCTIDLRSSDCLQCLEAGMGMTIPGKQRGRSASVSCEIRYDTYQFFSTIFYSRSGIEPSPAPMVAMASTRISATTGGEGKRGNKTKFIAFAGASGAIALLLIITLFIFLLHRRERKSTQKTRDGIDEKLIEAEIQIFGLNDITNATTNFIEQNKLGQGGFGPVYKGVLINGQEVAVKRLSTTSGQGLAEMKNEIDFVAKLQHKNLVKLLGYCLEGEEKLLVYEFLPNTSLDKFLFDPSRRMQLDWETRIKIIVGIGRGIRYLHDDSRLRIIHRDLKASNILLDSNMNPKISDFGLAKLFGNDETERNTSHIAGTFGYMAPEYVLHGLFSTKSDVFSFGVLVLEIITGEKQSSTEVSGDTLDLLSHVWKQWRQGKALQVIDKGLGDQYLPQEALRCIQIGLLCVQQEQVQRPNMASVVMMLSNLSKTLPTPSTPALYSATSFSTNSESSKDQRSSVAQWVKSG